MKNYKKIVVCLIIVGIVIALVPHFVSYDKIATFGLLLVFLPFLSLEYLIPSGLLKRFDINDKLPWYAGLTNYLIVYPMVNIFFILLLNVFFSFLPELNREIPAEYELLRSETFLIVIKMAAVLYISLVGGGLFTREVIKAKKQSKRL